MPHSSPHLLGCPQWAPRQDGDHTYLALLWLLASALSFGWMPSFRHLRRLWQESCWTGKRRLFGLLFHPPALKTPPEPTCEAGAQPASRRRQDGPEASRRTQSWPWEFGASPAQACSCLPAPSSASPSLPESSTAAAHTSKLIKAKGLINRRIEHFSRYGDFCGFSANLTLEPRGTPAPSLPTSAVLLPPSTGPGLPLRAGRGTQPGPRRKQRPCRLESLVALSAGGRGKS